MKSSRRPITKRASSASFRRDKLLLEPVATRIIEGSLHISRDTRVLIITDEAHKHAGEVFASRCKDRQAQPAFFVLEDLGARPHRVLPQSVIGAIARCEASIFMADFLDGEAAMRRELLLIAGQYRVRHAHIIGVTIESLIRGLQTDPRQIERMGSLLHSKVRGNKQLHVTTPRGTDLTVRFDSHYRWALHSGIITNGSWENLPSGELMTHPADVHGTFVCDITFSGQLGASLGLLRNAPVTLTIDHGRVVQVACPQRDVAVHIANWMTSGEDYDRVGAITLGINVGITQPTGEIICDQNIPSLHLSLGATFPEETGATWDTDDQMVFTSAEQDIDIDNKPLMRFGQYLQLI